MNIAPAVPLADWGMHGSGWWLLAAIPMMLFMGAMMWMMMRGMGSRSPRDSSPPRDTSVRRESPTETLERRLAAGELSVEEYRERRAALVSGTADPSGHDAEERLTSVGGEERRQS